IEQRHRFARLIALQRPDQVQFDIRIARAQLRPFRFRFLNPVLAEYPVTRLQYRQDALGTMSLGHRDELHPVRGSNSRTFRLFYAGENNLEVFGRIERNSPVCGGVWWHRIWSAQS